MSSNFILNYASKLLPVFKKDRIIDDARVVQTELNTNTIPSYETAIEIFKPSAVKSKIIIDLNKAYSTNMGGNSRSGMVADVWARLKSISDVVTLVSSDAMNNFEASVIVDGISLHKVSLIKTLELCGFISRYALRFLNYLYILETSEVSKNPGEYIGRQLSKGEIKELELYFSDFCRSLKALSNNPEFFNKEIEKLPNITVNPMSEATMANIGSSKLDPLNIFALSGFVSPIYRVGMMFAEYSVSRYKETKELKTNLELRRLYLENCKATGQIDEGMQKEIDIIQSRIDRCSEQIRKAEEKVGI
jgi:hypothetical protein